MTALAIPVSGPYSVTPGNVPASLLPGQSAVNLPDRRIFAGGVDGTPHLIYDPVAPQVISLSATKPGLTLLSGNASGGMSDTVPVIRIGGASDVDGLDVRYLTGGDQRLVRRVAGVETVMMQFQRTGGIALGGAPGSEAFRVQTGANWVNRVHASGGITGASPILIATGSDTDVGLQLQMKNAATFVLTALQNGVNLRQLFSVTAPANVYNGLGVMASATGLPVIVSSTGLDAAIPLRLVTTGAGDIAIGCGRPGWSPVALFGASLGNTDYVRFDGSDGSGPVTLSARSDTNANATLRLMGQAAGGVRIDGAFGFGVAPVPRQTITGSRSSGEALTNLFIALDIAGVITNATSS